MRWLCKVPREKRVAGLRSTGASIEDGDVACSVHGTISLPGLLFTAGLRTSGAGSKYCWVGTGQCCRGRSIDWRWVPGSRCWMEMKWLGGNGGPGLGTVDLSMAWALELRNRQDCL